MCSISVEPIPSTIRMPVFSNHASDTPAGSGSPADTHVCSESGRSSLSSARYAVGAVNSVVTRCARSVSSSRGGEVGAVDAPK